MQQIPAEVYQALILEPFIIAVFSNSHSLPWRESDLLKSFIFNDMVDISGLLIGLNAHDLCHKYGFEDQSDPYPLLNSIESLKLVSDMYQRLERE